MTSSLRVGASPRCVTCDALFMNRFVVTPDVSLTLLHVTRDHQLVRDGGANSVVGVLTSICVIFSQIALATRTFQTRS